MSRAAFGPAASLCAALLLCAGVGAGALAAKPASPLDRSFGARGVVRVAAPFAPVAGSTAAIEGFGAAANGTAYVVGNAYPCFMPECRRGAFLARFDADGAPDLAFGEGGAVFLHGVDGAPAVVADDEGRAIVTEIEFGKVILRRFESGGQVDTTFGEGGVVELPCDTVEAEVRLLNLSRGHIMVVVSRSLRGHGKRRYQPVASQVRLVELGPDGTRNESFGHSGTVDLRIHRPGPLEAAARTGEDAVLLGGSSGAGGPRRVWLLRVTAAGYSDRSFDHRATRSLRRLGKLGYFPFLPAIVPRADGTIAVVGTTDEFGGFVLRLRTDGTLADGFGKRGVVRLDTEPKGAVAGTGGAVFVVGAGKGSYSSTDHYSAYRVLAGGGLDPAYRGARGIKVPLPGEGIGIQPQGRGRALVTNLGFYECRQSCPSEPGMARYLR